MPASVPRTPGSTARRSETRDRERGLHARPGSHRCRESSGGFADQRGKHVAIQPPDRAGDRQCPKRRSNLTVRMDANAVAKSPRQTRPGRGAAGDVRSRHAPRVVIDAGTEILEHAARAANALELGVNLTKRLADAAVRFAATRRGEPERSSCARGARAVCRTSPAQMRMTVGFLEVFSATLLDDIAPVLERSIEALPKPD
jgi:hypothetical protein